MTIFNASVIEFNCRGINCVRSLNTSTYLDDDSKKILAEIQELHEQAMDKLPKEMEGDINFIVRSAIEAIYSDNTASAKDCLIKLKKHINNATAKYGVVVLTSRYNEKYLLVLTSANHIYLWLKDDVKKRGLVDIISMFKKYQLDISDKLPYGYHQKIASSMLFSDMEDMLEFYYNNDEPDNVLESRYKKKSWFARFSCRQDNLVFGGIDKFIVEFKDKYGEVGVRGVHNGYYVSFSDKNYIFLWSPDKQIPAEVMAEYNGLRLLSEYFRGYDLFDKDKNKIKRAYSMFYSAFINYFEKIDEPEVRKKSFDSVRKFITEERQTQVKYYITAASIFVTVVILIILNLALDWSFFSSKIVQSDTYHMMIKCAMFGTVGAFISTLFKIQDSLDLSMNIYATLLATIIKFMIGVITSGLIVIAIKSKIIFPDLDNNSPYLLYIIATFSGFSERFFQNIMQNMQEKLEKKPKAA